MDQLGRKVMMTLVLSPKRAVRSVTNRSLTRSLLFTNAPAVTSLIRHVYAPETLWMGSSLRRAATMSAESTQTDKPVLYMAESCVKRLKRLQSEEPNTQLLLRVSVEGGGCSGFQYNFTLDHEIRNDDKVFEKDGAKLVVDETSLDYLKGSTVEFSEELIRAAFRVVSNPKAEHGCSCGSSFSVKI